MVCEGKRTQANKTPEGVFLCLQREMYGSARNYRALFI
jgi:hypothetical protein